MSTLEILLGIFSLIICIFYITVFVISRKTIKKEELLLEKLTDKEIEKIIKIDKLKHDLIIYYNL